MRVVDKVDMEKISDEFENWPDPIINLIITLIAEKKKKKKKTLCDCN